MGIARIYCLPDNDLDVFKSISISEDMSCMSRGSSKLGHDITETVGTVDEARILDIFDWGVLVV
jgi:hypothetical protein